MIIHLGFGVTRGASSWWPMSVSFLALVVPLVFAVFVPAASAEEPLRGGNRLSKRAQLRYQDVLTLQTGTKWRGRVVARGEEYHILLGDGSEVVVQQGEVVSLTRELHPGLVHTGQVGLRASAGGEVAYAISETLPGLRYGPIVELGVTYNFRGPFEPELVVAISPVAAEPGAYAWQLALGARYYLNTERKAKPFTYTQVVLYGAYEDLALRTGPGLLLDLGPNVGLGFSQGVTLLSQRVPDDAFGVGYHVLLTAQGRF
jgi:hypothetical protein